MTLPRNPFVEISFQSPGTKPPVYLAASFTEPPWHPNEMNHRPASERKETESNDLEFFSTYQVPEGNHQYKFRLGNGDWWVCDESAETVLDEAGNRNNLLRVKSQRSHKQDSGARSAPQEKHQHAKAHVTRDESDLNPVWDFIGIDPTKSASHFSPPIHEMNCPLREHYNPDHPKYLSNAAEACRCGRFPTNVAIRGSGEERLAPEPQSNTGRVLMDGKPRPVALQLPTPKTTAGVPREYHFIPAPENTPVAQEKEAKSPDLKNEMCNNDATQPQSTLAIQDPRATSPGLAKGMRGNESQRMENAPTLEDVEDLASDSEDSSDAGDETSQRRHLSNADVESVRRSLTHLSPKSDQDLVNSVESDQPMSYDRDRHSEAPRLPHEALTSPRTYIPLSHPQTPRDTPRLFPQAHARIPTIDLYHDPIIPAFPTGDHGLLSRLAAAASGTERYEGHMGNETANQGELLEEEEEEEEELHAMVYTPTFKYEVPADYQQIRWRSTRHSLSAPTDGASDPYPPQFISKTPTGDGILARRPRPVNPRYSSLHESFPDVRRIDSYGQEIDYEDAAHVSRGHGSNNSSTESLGHRKVSGVSFKTAHSRSSSSRASSEGSEHAAEEITLWRRMWHILSSWLVSPWAVIMRQNMNDEMSGSHYYDAVTKHD